ncbi:LytR family transcriptional attenuator [Prauserella shujinwangii]|uniref:LytR family transcriptional attenuator n=1 Tax=Prauserella shujinwangii TaxID=1453103 RepID=A0A2T0LMJ2_9PSEU|nr:LCP family protein [Prauserella shujinwangii]PRX44297.1 LytR family transcriptional attenuator [Prauserella shujinwangii]
MAEGDGEKPDEQSDTGQAAETGAAETPEAPGGTGDAGTTGNTEYTGNTGNTDDAEPTATAGTPAPRPTPYPRQESPPPGRPRRLGRALRGAVRTVVALVSAAALLATGYAYSTLDEAQDNVHTTDALRQNEEVEATAPAEDDLATDILLVGADARTDMQGNPLPPEVLRTLRTESKQGVNTDTLIILRIPRDGTKPTAVSIPRDTWVDVPHGGKAKINSAYGAAKLTTARRLRAEGMTDQAEIERESDQAGRRALVKTVQDFTGVRIDHYAEVNLFGFYLLTEALGGVKVCLNHATSDKDSGASFAAGPQVVSGGEALSFVRQRKNLPRGDLDRIVRQQAFLASALHQVLSAGTLTSPAKLDKLTEALRRSLVLDPDLDLLKFAEQAKGIASGDIEFVTIPVRAVGTYSADGQSIVEVDVAEVRGFVQSVARGAPAPSGGGAAPGAAPRQITADGVACVN